MNEASGVLRPAVERYLRDEPLSEVDIATLRAYLRQWIMSGQWTGGEELEELRRRIDELTTREAIHEWTHLALDLDIDPW